MGIGKRIKEARADLDMTQKDLSKLVGVTKSAIANYENEVSHPKEQVLYSLMNVLKREANYFFQDEMSTIGNKNELYTDSELNLIKKYRDLDGHGRDMVDTVLLKEHERSISYAYAEACRPEIIDISRYLVPASAGQGVYLEGCDTEIIQIPKTEKSTKADFVVPVSGDSMEPIFSNGDLLLVKAQSDINHNQLGLFVLNGCGYVKKLFKKEGVVKLISLNVDYDDITVNEYDDIVCKGKILGKV